MLVAKQSFDGPVITVEREETIGHQHQSSRDQDASEIEKMLSYQKKSRTIWKQTKAVGLQKQKSKQSLFYFP